MEGRRPPEESQREGVMFRKLSFAVAASMMIVGAAYADPIEGNWKTDAGETAAISRLRKRVLHHS